VGGGVITYAEHAARSASQAAEAIAAADTKFSPRRALRRAGVRGREGAASSVRAADRAAAAAPGAATKAVKRNAPGLFPSTSPGSLGGTLVWAFAAIIGLALLHNALGGRGPVAVQRIFAMLGGGITKLVSPHDPLFGRGHVAAMNAGPIPAGRTPVPTPRAAKAGATDAGTDTTLSGSPTLRSSPTKLHGVSFTGESLVGVHSGFLSALALAAKAAGVTIIDVISARRSPEGNQAAGGVPNSNHLTGNAIDGRAYIPGRGFVPLGTLATLVSYGLRTGNVPGFFNGQPDPNHVDDGANQH
jgi:hypothetical protein